MNALTSAALAGLAVATLMTTLRDDTQGMKDEPVQLGNFSVSLAVKDIKASKAFYEKLDFAQVAGNIEQNWVVLQNGTTTVGLFHGMFERNMMTFNPGWTTEGKPLAQFEDVRDLQKRLEASGLTLTTKADPKSTGPASFSLADPDGNPILVDQHVPKPTK